MDYSKFSDEEIARSLAEMIRVTNELRERLELYEKTKQVVQFEFQMRYDKETREKHSFLLPSTSGTVKEKI